MINKIKVSDILIGLLIILIIVLEFNFGGIDKATRCNKLKGDYCNKYELDKFNK